MELENSFYTKIKKALVEIYKTGETEKLLDQYPVVKGQAQMALSSSAQKTLAKAEKEMASLKDQFLSVEHVLLSMSQAEDNAGEGNQIEHIHRRSRYSG